VSLLTKECNLLFYYAATAVHEIDRRSMNGHGATLLTYWATALHEEVAPADSEWLGAASLTYTATALHEEVAPADSEWLGAALLTYAATAVHEIDRRSMNGSVQPYNRSTSTSSFCRISSRTHLPSSRINTQYS